jgi:hypothetical protein
MDSFTGVLAFLNGRLYQVTAATGSTFTIADANIPNGTYSVPSVEVTTFTGTWKRATLSTW